VWSPKPEAAEWVAVRHGLAGVAERAVRLRLGEDVEPLREDEVETILAVVRRRLR
jgi:hypothetical protein